MNEKNIGNGDFSPEQKMKKGANMLGAIAGDVIGSRYERNAVKTKYFGLFSKESRFTDDTVLTIAIAQSILNEKSYIENIVKFARSYPNAGYGGSFWSWMQSDVHKPYNSWGNGSAMRVSPVGFAFNDEATVLKEAKKSAEVTHNHIEGIKGAQATALAIFLARIGKSKEEIKKRIERDFNYDLNRSVDEIRPQYSFDVSCQGSVPESIICFLDSTDYEDCIRNAVSLGGDADTMAAIAGGIAQAYYKEIPKFIVDGVYQVLPDEFIAIIERFEKVYG